MPYNGDKTSLVSDILRLDLVIKTAVDDVMMSLRYKVVVHDLNLILVIQDDHSFWCFINENFELVVFLEFGFDL